MCTQDQTHPIQCKIICQNYEDDVDDSSKRGIKAYQSAKTVFCAPSVMGENALSLGVG